MRSNLCGPNKFLEVIVDTPRTTGRATCSRPLTTDSPQRKGDLRLGEYRPCRYQISGDGRRHYSSYTLAGVIERLVLDGRL